MTSLLVITKDPQKRLQYTQQLCEEKQISSFDITIVKRETASKQNAQSIGIEEIKKVQKSLFLKPIQSPYKMIVIQEAHLLTIEAQNALLKVLEEPPEKTYIVLHADTKEVILPTIHSRCQIIQLEDTQTAITDKEYEEITQFLTDLPNLGIGERMKIAEQMTKEKTAALLWLRSVIMVQRERMLQSQTPKNELPLMRSLQMLYTTLKTTNTNPRLALENTLLLI